MPTPKTTKRATGYEPDVRHERYKKVCKKIKAWEARQSRAQTMLDKLRKTRSYYEKLAGA